MQNLSNGQTTVGVTLPLIAPSDTTGSLLETNPFSLVGGDTSYL